MNNKITWDLALEQINKVAGNSLPTMGQEFHPIVTVIGLTTQRAWEMSRLIEGRIDSRIRVEFITSSTNARSSLRGKTRVAVVLDCDAKLNDEAHLCLENSLKTVVCECAKNGLQTSTDQLFIRV